MKTQSNHTLEMVEGEELDRMKKHFHFAPDGFARLTPGRWVYPGAFQFYVDRVYNFEWREDDVLLMGWPKTGTTWMQEILWTMRNNPDLSHDDANLPILTRVPIIDTDMFTNPKFYASQKQGERHSHMLKEFREVCPEGDPTEGIYLQMTKAMVERRTLKTHFPFSLLHPRLLDTVKIVYIARNPRDAFVSFYHMCVLLKAFSYSDSLECFVDQLLRDEIIYAPFHKHIEEAWNRRNHPNVHFVFFEDLKADASEEITKLDEFLGTKLTEEQISKIVHHTSFSEMKKRNNFTNTKGHGNVVVNEDVESKTGGFFRKGNAGGWKEELSPDLLAKIDQMTEKYMSDIPFKYSS